MNFSFSAKLVYGIIAMENVGKGNGAPVRCLDIAKRYPGISPFFLEQIFRVLRRKGFVRSLRGPGGGYVLTRSMDKISLKDIVMAFESPTRKDRYLPEGVREIEREVRAKVLSSLEGMTLEDINNTDTRDTPFSRQIRQWSESNHGLRA